ncbi:MAG: hypothetical protein Q4G04_00105 [bacterium]|nr:hypothetical protein [bacterium]
MKNILEYYYNLSPTIINKKDEYYYFKLKNDTYYLVPYNNQEEIKNIYEINILMINSNILVHEIIINKNKEPFIFYNNRVYILYKTFINPKSIITLNEISYISKIRINYSKQSIRDNWPNLWSKKIDYFEYQINQFGKKYPIIVESFSYFVGLAENAISYVRNTMNEVLISNIDIGVISHKNLYINNPAYHFYNPLNIIIDHQARDIAEYIKLAFFNDNKKIFQELSLYFTENKFTVYGIRLLYGRILYPSYYFELYEQILRNQKKEYELLKLISKISKYEQYLKDVYEYLNSLYTIPKVEWLYITR